MTRELIVIDCESTGLDPNFHVPIEIAAINLNTGKALRFVPELRPEFLAQADPAAMAINRYFERRVWEDALSRQETQDKYELLFNMLRGNTLGGSNPRFDADMIRRGYAVANSAPTTNLLAPRDPGFLPDEVWYHRLQDLAAYSCGALGADPAEPPGLAAVRKALGVKSPDEHTALGDARATAECFTILKAKYSAAGVMADA